MSKFEDLLKRAATQTRKLGHPDRAAQVAVENITKARPLSPSKQEMLASQIKAAVMAYSNRLFFAHYEGRSTLHKIAAPLAKVIALLEDNIDEACIALGDGRRASAKYLPMMQSLREIAGNLPSPPAGRGQGRPSPLDLYDLVNRLADCWEEWTGKKFKHKRWQKTEGSSLDPEPVTVASKFVYDIVKAVDPTQLQALQNVMEETVTNRRKRLARKTPL